MNRWESSKSIDCPRRRYSPLSRASSRAHALGHRFTSVRTFPRQLEELVPWDVCSVPPPLIIFRLDWCYEGGEDYFHLGYVTREHWSSPKLIVRSFSSAGDDPDGSLDCSLQIAVLEVRIPGLNSVVEDLDR